MTQDAGESSVTAKAGAVVPALLTLSLIRQIYTPKSDRTFRRWISAGTFPGPDVKVGGKLQLWARETVEGWISDQREKLSRSA